MRLSCFGEGIATPSPFIFEVINMDIHNCKNIYDAIKIAEECLGYLEKATPYDLGDLTPEGKVRNAGYGNYTLYWDWFKTVTGDNYQGSAYCAGWLSVGYFVRAFGVDVAKKLLCGDLFIWCPDGYNQFKKAGRIYDTPEVGDVPFYWNDNLGRWAHTGLVIKKLEDNGWVATEANTSSGNNTVVRNGGATVRKSYTYGGKKVAFGRPPYEEYGISMEDIIKDIVSSEINTNTMFGIIIDADTLNVRDIPTTKESKVVGQLKKGMRVNPTLKAFDEKGTRWYYVPEKDGWISGNYVHGWIQEEDGRWWYALYGGGWYTGDVFVIDGVSYIFDDAGYMVKDPVTVYPDENGALHTKKR